MARFDNLARELEVDASHGDLLRMSRIELRSERVALLHTLGTADRHDLDALVPVITDPLRPVRLRDWIEWRVRVIDRLLDRQPEREVATPVVIDPEEDPYDR